jgi:lipid-binding SYLF domain-containing protein
MRTLRLALLTALFAITLGASISQAAGPLDGSYSVVASAYGVSPVPFYVVVLQNGNDVGLGLLYPGTGGYA